MAVRRRRPLVPPPYPRRNRYTPLSSGQTALCSLRPTAKAHTAPLSLLVPSQTLRWFVMGALGIWAKSARLRFRSQPAADCENCAHSLAPPLPTANASLVCGGSPLEFGQTTLHSLPAAPRARNAPLSLLVPSQTLRWFVMGALWGLDKVRSTPSRLCRAGAGKGLRWVSWQDTSGIVTHPNGGMCYNSMTNQVFVSFTISLAGVTLASSR